LVVVKKDDRFGYRQAAVTSLTAHRLIDGLTGGREH